MKKYIMISFFAWAFTYGVSAQNLSTRSNKFSVNLSDEKNLKDTSIPVITWVEPVNEVVLHREGKLHLTVGIHSPIQIKMVEISIREKDQAASRGSLMVKPKENEQHAQQNAGIAENFGVFKIARIIPQKKGAAQHQGGGNASRDQSVLQNCFLHTSKFLVNNLGQRKPIQDRDIPYFRVISGQ